MLPNTGRGHLLTCRGHGLTPVCVFEGWQGWRLYSLRSTRGGANSLTSMGVVHLSKGLLPEWWPVPG